MSEMRKHPLKHLAPRLRELRTQYGRTQKECADALGVSQSVYSEMESGKMLFRRRDLVTLAVLYGLTLEEAFPDFTDGREEAA